MQRLILFTVQILLRIVLAPVAAGLYIAAAFSETATATLISLTVALDAYKRPDELEDFVAAADSSEPLIPILFSTETEARKLVEKLNRQLDFEPWRRN